MRKRKRQLPSAPGTRYPIPVVAARYMLRPALTAGYNPHMEFPYTFDQAFLDDLPYEPSVLFLDRIESLDKETRTLVCRMPTDVPLPLTDAQRVHPTKHPKHVSGGVIMHVTGMLGFVYAYYVHGLRHAAGWTGYGTHVHKAVFRHLTVTGAPLLCECRELKRYKLGGRIFATFSLIFRQEGTVVFESEQSAMWVLDEASADAVRRSQVSAPSV